MYPNFSKSNFDFRLRGCTLYISLLSKYVGIRVPKRDRLGKPSQGLVLKISTVTEILSFRQRTTNFVLQKCLSFRN